jgi:uncharacterized membrane protein YhhN
VNAATAGALAVAAVFALGDWYAKARTNRVLEYVCKPATMVMLIAAALALDPAADAHTRRSWFVVALVASLAGDVFLMLPRDLFVFGLGAFLVAHLCYIAGFWSHGPSAVAFVVAGALVVAALTPLAIRILRAVDDPQLRPAVATYIVVIAAMLATALATGNAIAAIGAGLFVVSDSMIAWDRFVNEFPGAGVAIMVTYHLGQAGLVLSLLR